MKIAGTRVVITGAGSGIGAAAALRFAKGGAEVIAVDLDGETAERTAAVCASAGGPNAHAYVCDVADAGAVTALAEQIEREQGGVDVLVKRFLSDPLTHSVDSAESPVAAMTHHVLAVATPDVKTEVVRHLASGTGRRLLFMRTKHQAKRLARQLTAGGIPAVDLHGNLSQNARQRNLEAFSTGAARVLHESASVQPGG